MHSIRALRQSIALAGLLLFSVGPLKSEAADRIANSVWDASTTFCIDYRANPDAAHLAKFDLCILDPAAKVNVSKLRQSGHLTLAYLSLVEAARGSPSAKLAASLKIPVITRNGDWDTEVLDVTNPAWAEFILDGLAKPASAKGFDGFFLDTADSVEFITAAQPGKAAECHRALIGLIRALHEKFPGSRIILNRGFDLLDEAAPLIQGVLIEGLFQSWDAGRRRYTTVATDGTAWLLQHIQSIQRRHVPVFVADYVSPVEQKLALRTAGRISRLGCVALITTPELDGTVLAPHPTSQP